MLLLTVFNLDLRCSVLRQAQPQAMPSPKSSWWLLDDQMTVINQPQRYQNFGLKVYTFWGIKMRLRCFYSRHRPEMNIITTNKAVSSGADVHIPAPVWNFITSPEIIGNWNKTGKFLFFWPLLQFTVISRRKLWTFKLAGLIRLGLAELTVINQPQRYQIIS